MASTISLTKSLRTNKVANDPGNVANTFRIFTSNPTCSIADYRLDQYNRPASIYGGLSIEGSGNGSNGGSPGCFSPLYRIEVENLQRPQYSQYLNVPQGIMNTVNEYSNRPHTDMLGANRDRAFGLDGVYRRMSYPSNATDPSSAKDNLLQQEWFGNQLLTKMDNRLWLNSADLSSGF